MKHKFSRPMWSHSLALSKLALGLCRPSGRNVRGLAALAILVLFASPGAVFGQAQCPVVEWELTAGQTIDVGKVTVTNDTNGIYVTYVLEYPGATFSEELQMWGGTDQTLVPSYPNRPPPGQFCQVDGGACSGQDGRTTAVGLSTYQFFLTWDELSIVNEPDLCDSVKLYVYTHATVDAECVQGVDDGCTDGPLDEETAWGGDQPGGPPSWWFWGEYTICCDEGNPPPQQCETSFGKGPDEITWVWTKAKRANPESLESLEITRNRWGWAIKLPTDDTEQTLELWSGAGLNQTANGTYAGSATLKYNVGTSSVEGTFDTSSTGYELEEVHVYARDAAPETMNNLAPGQYDIVVEFDPNVNTYPFSIQVPDTDQDGFVWVILHSVVCAFAP